MHPKSVADRLITLHNLAWAAFSVYWSYGVLQELRGPHVTCTCGDEDDAMIYGGLLFYAALVFLSALSASGVMQTQLRQRGVLAAIFQTTLAILLTIPAVMGLCSPGRDDDYASTLLIALATAIGGIATSTVVWWKYRTGRWG